jgi:hypothetical protein
MLIIIINLTKVFIFILYFSLLHNNPLLYKEQQEQKEVFRI